MRWRWAFAVAALWTGSALCADQPKPALLPCPAGFREVQCNPSGHELKDAQNAFRRGLKLQAKAPEQAYQEFDRAAQLVPRNLEYITARELALQQLVYNHIARGNSELENGKQIEALADFRNAVSLDPTNQFAQDRLRESLGDSAPRPSTPPTVVEESLQIRLVPNANRASFHFRGDSRELLTSIATAFGVSAQIEDSVTSRRVFFDIDDVDFYKAMLVAGQITKTFWAALSDKLMVIAADTPDNHRQYERLAMRTFYVPTETPTALNDVMNLLRNLFEIRFVTPNAGSSTLVVR